MVIEGVKKKESLDFTTGGVENYTFGAWCVTHFTLWLSSRVTLIHGSRGEEDWVLLEIYTANDELQDSPPEADITMYCQRTFQTFI